MTGGEPAGGGRWGAMACPAGRSVLALALAGALTVGRAMGRTGLAAALMALALLLGSVAGPAPAAAHGGTRVIERTVGPYRISATVARREERIDETIVVLDAATRNPRTDVQVAVSLADGSGAIVGPFVARRLGTGYEALYPPPEPAGGWRVRITLVDGATITDVEHAYRAPEQEWAIGSGVTGFVLMAAGILLPIVATFFVLSWPGRRRAPSGDAAAGPRGARLDPADEGPPA